MSGSEASSEGTPAPKGKSPVVWIVLALVTGVGGAAATYFLAPKPAAAESSHHGEEHEEEAAPSHKEDPPIVVPWPPLVFDIKDAEGASRHVKLVVTLEVKDDKTKPEAEAFAPRGRAALLGYVRDQKFEVLLEPSKFNDLQATLTKLIQEHMGKGRVTHVWITDLVAQ